MVGVFKTSRKARPQPTAKHKGGGNASGYKRATKKAVAKAGATPTKTNSKAPNTRTLRKKPQAGRKKTASATTSRRASQASTTVSGVAGVPIRQPYPGEAAFFRNNPNVAGMATEDNKVILNPYTKLSDQERQAVVVNETARVLMRQPKYQPTFELTPEQRSFLDSTTYRKAPQLAQKATIAARIISGDPSAGTPTAEQLRFVDRLRQAMTLPTQHKTKRR